ncbi:hypothetical protein OIU34_20285 [Pararhizobium sp. BT-229]|uniref:hypothetical protein n=1 Tax=Pararhizobium sp. BT-229 TaxID=2986923 RepID=UPI0021F7F1D0|nr:hypothetical protein [Pararhizobium sp. BT-229]MCV9964227.1 hypothetical protein [Pararhizobium sp. BT-229]
MHVPGKYGNFDERFCDELKTWIGGRRVLETFAGNGLLASMLANRNVDIVSTTTFSGHDAHHLGMFHDVIEMDAVAAVSRYGSECDILLMCWPTTDEATTRSALLWEGKPIVFIGEVTDHSLGFGGLGGCATDLFFDITVETERFESYRPKNMLDQAAVRMLRADARERLAMSFSKTSFRGN